jgi:hypothetical protein
MSADTLTISSRAFYERTRFKFVASMAVLAGSCMLLGFVSQTGGQSLYNSRTKDSMNNLSTKQEESYDALIQGYGFAAFFHICGFIFAVVGAIYLLPQVCGSANETKMFSSPMEIDSTGYSPYNDAGRKPSNV